MKKVLLLGDSIRLGYQPFVEELLKGKAEVYGPDDNCRFALYTLWHLWQWVALSGGDVDVVHWNNGIWDINTHLQDGSSVSTPQEYAVAIRRVLKELRALCPRAKIIFATTTAVNDKHPNVKNADVAKINAAAIKIMREEGIEINDLNSVTAENPSYLCEDMLHLSGEGYRVAARAVSEAISRYL